MQVQKACSENVWTSSLDQFGREETVRDMLKAEAVIRIKKNSV